MQKTQCLASEVVAFQQYPSEVKKYKTNNDSLLSATKVVFCRFKNLRCTSSY